MAVTDATRTAPPLPRTARPGSPAGRSRRGGAAWVLPPALGLAGLLAALAGIHVLLLDFTWWFVCAGVAALVVAAGAVVRRWVRPWAAPLAGALAAVVLGTPIVAPGTLFLGFVPTGETVDAVVAAVARGMSSIAVQRVPAVPVDEIVFLLALLAAAAGVAVEATAARAPALTAVPLLAVLGVPPVFREGIVDPLCFGVALVAYLALLRVGRPPIPVRWPLATGAAALACALAAPAVFPAVDDVSRPGGGGGLLNGVNPMISLGDDLRRESATVALSYETAGGDGVYLRLATLDNFNGINWEPAIPPLPAERGDDGELPLPGAPGLGDDVATAPGSVAVRFGDVSSRWLPLPYPALTVTGLSGVWNQDPEGLTMRTTRNGGITGEDYQVEYLDVHPSGDQLRMSLPATGNTRYLRIPGRAPDVLVETAQRVAGHLPTSWERALALQEFFTGGEFAYSEDAPVEGGYDGSGLRLLAAFLEAKSGYCVHYASAMAVMSRLLGIPSRVVVGFQPGVAETLEDGTTRWVVTTHDLHAWPELYFAGVGWLRFEPTPGRGSLPRYSFPDAVEEVEVDPVTGDAITPTAAPTAPPDTSVVLPDEELPVASGSLGERPDPLPAVMLGIAGVVLLIAAVPALLRAGIRWRRLRAMRLGRDAAAAAWAEVRDTARDHGWEVPDGETPRAFAGRLEVVLQRDRDAVRRLRGRVEAVAYARPADPTMSPAELRAVRRAIARASTSKERLRAIVAPVSLVRRG